MESTANVDAYMSEDQCDIPDTPRVPKRRTSGTSPPPRIPVPHLSDQDFPIHLPTCLNPTVPTNPFRVDNDYVCGVTISDESPNVVDDQTNLTSWLIGSSNAALFAAISQQFESTVAKLSSEMK